MHFSVRLFSSKKSLLVGRQCAIKKEKTKNRITYETSGGGVHLMVMVSLAGKNKII